MCSEKYLAIDVGGTAIKYVRTDRSAKIRKINEMKTNRDKEELFNSLDEIIAPHINDIGALHFHFQVKLMPKRVLSILQEHSGRFLICP